VNGFSSKVSCRLILLPVDRGMAEQFVEFLQELLLPPGKTPLYFFHPGQRLKHLLSEVEYHFDGGQVQPRVSWSRRIRVSR